MVSGTATAPQLRDGNSDFFFVPVYSNIIIFVVNISSNNNNNLVFEYFIIKDK